MFKNKSLHFLCAVTMWMQVTFVWCEYRLSRPGTNCDRLLFVTRWTASTKYSNGVCNLRPNIGLQTYAADVKTHVRINKPFRLRAGDNGSNNCFIITAAGLFTWEFRINFQRCREEFQ